MIKLTKANKILTDNSNGKTYNIYKDNYGEGILMSEAMGVTSGQRLLYLSQLRMEMFNVIEFTTN